MDKEAKLIHSILYRKNVKLKKKNMLDPNFSLEKEIGKVNEQVFDTTQELEGIN